MIMRPLTTDRPTTEHGHYERQTDRISVEPPKRSELMTSTPSILLRAQENYCINLLSDLKPVHRLHQRLFRHTVRLTARQTIH